ncbi:MAG: metallophosphatase family protein [Chitinispirillia bacterium]|nr:metallophosphatase family protein [Chitinispirillia bacterium]MCL2268039.1 metallophosphatase family protein [Chitinispirillia bacterium]
MRLAFISDIHANLEALESVLADLEDKAVDDIYCLGDVVGYGANPNECVEIVSKRCKCVLLGNHDAVATGLLTTQHFNVHARIAIEWTAETLLPENKKILAAQPLAKTTDTLTMVHATPYQPGMWYYITSLEEAYFNFQSFDTKICLVGHTHIPMIIALDEEEIYVHQEKSIVFKERDNLRLLINIGSVGQPRDRNPESSYGILDTEEEKFTLHRVPYDIAKTQSKMKKIKMPDFLVNRLAEGR